MTASWRNEGFTRFAAYLSAWNRHIDLCTALIPPDRRLILTTHELDRSHEQLARFLDIPADRLDVGKGHLNPSTWSGRIETLVDPGLRG